MVSIDLTRAPGFPLSWPWDSAVDGTNGKRQGVYTQSEVAVAGRYPNGAFRTARNHRITHMIATSRDSQGPDNTLLHAIVDNAVDGIIAIDAAGSVCMMNRAAERLFGYSARDVIGRNISMLMPLPYRHEHDNYLQNYLQTGRRQIIGIGREVEGQRKDGSVFPMYLSVAEVCNGDTHLFTGFVHDLTDRKRTETALRALAASTAAFNGDEFFRSCVRDLAGAYGVRYAFAGVFADATRSSIQTLAAWGDKRFIPNFQYHLAGTPCEDVVNRSMCLIHEDVTRRYPDDKLLVDMRVESYFGAPLISSSGTSIGLVAVMDSKPIVPSVWAEPVLGTFASRMALELERMHTAEDMQRLRTYLQNIVDSMPSVLVGLDTEGHVTEWNQSAERATGIAAQQASGQRFEELLPELGNQTGKIRAAIDAREVTSLERIPSERDDGVHYSDVMVYPLVANGATGAVIRIDDVTNRVRIEEMMVQTEKMMSVGGLAAGMAHEINNPLSAVLQSIQNICRRLDAALPSNQRAAEEAGVSIGQVRSYLDKRGILGFVEGAQEAAIRAVAIVTDMLAFSRGSDHRLAPARVDEMLDRVMRLAASDYDLSKHYDFRQIDVVRRYDAELPPVLCNCTEIEQVVLNIIKNASEALASSATPPPQRITLRTLRQGDYACIELEDNGPGMDEATRARVFDPFFTTKPPGKGTGLGLSVAYFIICEQHRGTISVRSKPGAGTRFTIRLPLATEVDS